MVDPTGFEPVLVGANSTRVTNYPHGPMSPGKIKSPNVKDQMAFVLREFIVSTDTVRAMP